MIKKRTLIYSACWVLITFFNALGQDSTVVAPANPNFRIGPFGQFLLGKHYREVWETPVEAPIFDINSFRGGMRILKLGGGNQTKTLRMIDSTNVQFNLRTIDKYPALTLPKSFRKTWVNKVVKDQISTAHPYGFMVMPKLAEAIETYHTNPKLYYVPKNSSFDTLQNYTLSYGDKLFMIEIRPDENLSEFDQFGNSKNVVGTEKLFEKLREDNDNSIDAFDFAKVRLLDIIVGDWDRHEDQWRWAEFDKDDKGTLFRAVPRDRSGFFKVRWLFTYHL